MAAARDILLTEGSDAVGYVAVAERSGVGRTTLYRHWPTIEHLLRDVLARECEISHRVPIGDLRVDLVEELDGLRRQLTRPPTVRSMIAIMSRASDDSDFARLWSELRETCSKTVVRILRTGQDGGLIDAGLDIARAEAVLVGPVFYCALVECRPATRTFVEAIVDDFLRGHRVNLRGIGITVRSE